jgi:flagellar hook assembly protein FlgD
VSLNVFDANGRLVRSLVNGVGEAGSQEITWDGRDNANMPVSSGVYFYRLTAGKFSESKKMVLLK